ncbi:hypothetical protein ACUNWD_02100 [Sunxiuqinia sp. A32]|uniref:hypothetical protein n=1 Tax=Sunxiuqinia sp. A32 TaxID=3461496 RepID=UPI00404632FD
MKKKPKKSRLAENPAWALAIIAILPSLFFFPFMVDESPTVKKYSLAIVAILHDAYIAFACFLPNGEMSCLNTFQELLPKRDNSQLLLMVRQIMFMRLLG